MKLCKLFTELKRRNVYKVAVAYAVIGWLLIQVAMQIFYDNRKEPDEIFKWLDMPRARATSVSLSKYR